MAASTQTSKSGLAAGTEALFGLLYVQTHVVRAIDDAFDRAHGTGLSGFELMARLSRMHADGALCLPRRTGRRGRTSRVSRELAEENSSPRDWLERAVSPHDGRLPRSVRLTDTGRNDSRGEMEATFAEAVGTHLVDRLTPEQLGSIAEVCRALGAPHC